MCLLLLRWNSIKSRSRKQFLGPTSYIPPCLFMNVSFLTAQSYLTSIQKRKCSSGRWGGGWCNTWTSADGADGDVGEHGLALLPLQRGGGGGGPAQDPPGQARQAKEAAHRGAEGARHAAGPSPSVSSSLRESLQDDDPCLVSTMTESLLPFLPGAWCHDFCLVHSTSIWKEFWTMIFFRAGLGWCKATILATTRDPGHLPSQPLIWKRMISSLWASCVKLCPGDQADVDLSRRPVCGLAEPERGAQLPSPPLRTCYEALGRRPLSTQGCFDEGEASCQDHSNLKKTQESLSQILSNSSSGKWILYNPI